MDKELEALERLKNAPSFMGGTVEYQSCTKSETLLIQDYEIVKQALLELKSINETNPSEALKCILDIKNNYKFYVHNKKDIDYQCNTIKQALLKAQEPKQFKDSKEFKIEIPESSLMDYNPVKKYLKWEDLEFKGTKQTMKVLLNGKEYSLSYFIDSSYRFVDLYTNDNRFLMCRCVNCYPTDVQFFNDLHLERVEE